MEEPKYISLRDAARTYGYTRDHLGLMIRQNKLKGEKLGSYYVTTDGWMVDYIKNFADLGHPTVKNKFSNKFSLNAAPGRGVLSPLAAAQNKTVKKSPPVFKNGAAEAPNIAGDLKEKIAGDLAVYIDSNKAAIDDRESFRAGGKETKPASDCAPDAGFADFAGAPYVILPIRAMNEKERGKILEKLK